MNRVQLFKAASGLMAAVVSITVLSCGLQVAMAASTVSLGSMTRVVGTDTGGQQIRGSVDCPQGYVVTGIGYKDAPAGNSDIASDVSIQCAKLESDGRLTSTTGWINLAGSENNSRQFATFVCPSGSAAYGIWQKDLPTGSTDSDFLDGMVPECYTVTNEGLKQVVAYSGNPDLDSNPRSLVVSQCNGNALLTGIEVDKFGQNYVSNPHAIDSTIQHCSPVYTQNDGNSYSSSYSSYSYSSSYSSYSSNNPQCSDGIDNDGDGLVDFGRQPQVGERNAPPASDPGCSSQDDNDEGTAGPAACVSGDGVYGPFAYLSTNYSPFRCQTGWFYNYLENFEDHSLNTPGVTVGGASIRGVSTSISSEYRAYIIDSVDSDDGAIDGKCGNGSNACESYYVQPANQGVEFTFNGNSLNGLPTHVSLVWTDGYEESGNSPVTFEVYDANGNKYRTLVSQNIGDKTVYNTTGEDRIFAAINMNGISRITMRASDTKGMEVDHLFYGRIGNGSNNDDYNGTFRITKTDGRTTAYPGDTLNYTITVRNETSSRKNNVRIIDTLPSSLSFLSASDAGHVSGRTVTWYEDFDAYETITVTVRARVSSSARNMTITNTAEVDGYANASDRTEIIGDNYNDHYNDRNSINQRSTVRQNNESTINTSVNGNNNDVNVSNVQSNQNYQVYNANQTITNAVLPRTGAGDNTSPLDDASRFLSPVRASAAALPMILWVVAGTLGLGIGGVASKRYFL